MNEKNFLTEYKKLNLKQRQAVDEIEGPVMVVAGPGTGKTQILAMRIAQILRKTQTNPSNILCLTFTNSGVQAMKQRLLEIIGPPSYQIHVHTFHQFCNEVISEFPEKFLIANELNQLSDLEQIELIQKILLENEFNHIKPFKAPFHYQKAIIEAINKLKQEDITQKYFTAHIKKELANFKKIKDLRHQKGPYKNKIKAEYQTLYEQLLKNQELARVYTLYQDYISKEGKYDYADMILYVVNAFKNDTELLAHFQEKFQYILVDEYQDTNSAQNEVVELLASFYENPNVFVVGDDEQSIFRFQGASLENILLFSQKHPHAKIIVLEQNYRSGQRILDASRHVILQNKNQIYHALKISKILKSVHKQTKGEILVGEFSNGLVENFFIAKEIQKLVKQGVKLSEIAVLYRNHRDAEELIDFLSKLNVAYKLETGDNVLDDPEIFKIIKYFQALSLEKETNELLVEIMHYPYFGIFSLDIYKLVVTSRTAKKPIFEMFKNTSKLELENSKKVKEFYQTFLDCRRACFTKKFDEAFSFVIERSGYLGYLFSLKDNVRHFNRLQTLYKYIQNLNLKNKNMRLSDFIEHLRLLDENKIKIREQELTAEYDGVSLMTAHKAKGLEFSVVFILHLTDKHWGKNSKRELIKLPTNLLKIQKLADDDEEERRLFYVGLTRAKRRIYLTYAQSYSEAENQTFELPSKFIGELPQRLTERIKTKPFEKNFSSRLKLTFGLKKWQYNQAMAEFLKKLVTDFSFNPTALNSYLNCPQRFLYDNILRVPKAKTFAQSYGTAVHRALENFFKEYIKNLKLPEKRKLLEYFKDGLNFEILDEKEQINALKKGGEILADYYDFYAPTWRKQGRPIACELNFSSHNIHFEKIPITGIIDKLELMDKISGKVRIVDYKTSAPKSLNFLQGKTKEKDTSYLYQAYFYKLLAETDPLFSWQVGEIVFDFVAPEKKKFKRIAIPIDLKEYEQFKKTLKETYAKILNLEFLCNAKSCQKGEKPCDYFRICQIKS